jgi:hypothetical protein
MPEQTLASSKSFNDDSIQKMFFTQALQPASTPARPAVIEHQTVIHVEAA